MEPTPDLKVNQVFVPGAQPTHTYNPRERLGLESKVRDYLDERHSMLCVTGQTKIGKTVLVKRMLEDYDALWVSGGTVTTIDKLWEAVADDLALNTAVASDVSVTREAAGGFGVEVQLGVGKVSGSDEKRKTEGTTRRLGRTRPVEVAVRKELRASARPLVIDDFHYISPAVQSEIVRSLKDLIFDGLPVIVLAVMHRADDIVRAEKEMTGRVKQLPIEIWSNDELRGIAASGFSALNLIDEDEVITERLVVESFSSPHLMQEFCLEVVKANGIRTRLNEPQQLQPPSWEPFFRGHSASMASKVAFDRLARGRQQRAARKRRRLEGGGDVDIYGALLEAIGRTGPTNDIAYEDLRLSLRAVLADDMPAKHEVVRVLIEMSNIAKEIGGEPVVEYDREMSMLHVSDPYFAFYLRWSTGNKPGS